MKQMEDELKLEIIRMQKSIVRIIGDYKLDITSLGSHITEALTETGSPYTFKLIKMEEAKKWKEEYQ